MTKRNVKKKDYANDAELIKDYFSKLSPKTVEKIYRIYENDMNLFGYSFNLNTLESGGFEN